MARRFVILIIYALNVAAICAATSNGNERSHVPSTGNEISGNVEQKEIEFLDDKQFKEFEDSLISVLYPQPCLKDLDNYPQKDQITDSDTVPPYPDVHSFTKRQVGDTNRYHHFKGESIIEEIIIFDNRKFRLNKDSKEAESFILEDFKFWEVNWARNQFTDKEEFDTIWNK